MTECSGGGKFVSMQIGEAHDRLHQLDMQDRHHWAAAITIMLALSATLFAFTLPGIGGAIHIGKLVALSVRALLLLVTLFGLNALRNQRKMAQMRREVAAELAVIAAAETLHIAINPGREVERRDVPRAACDQKLTVLAQAADGKQQLYGRIVDICEHGMGAIVPGVLAPGQDVILQFSLSDEAEQFRGPMPARQNLEKPPREFKLSAIVRQRSGFRYGFNFVAMSDSDRAEIERYRAGDKVVSIAGKGAPAVSGSEA
jgi:hypothetical protein